jgi:hypothetical protein
MSWIMVFLCSKRPWNQLVPVVFSLKDKCSQSEKLPLKFNVLRESGYSVTNSRLLLTCVTVHPTWAWQGGFHGQQGHSPLCPQIRKQSFKVKFVPLLNKVSRHEYVSPASLSMKPGRRMGSGSIAPRIPNIGTRWKWVVYFTPRPLYPRRKSP